MFVFDGFWLVFIVGTALPALVALVTRQVASSSVKAITLALLSAIGGALIAIQENSGAFELNSTLQTIFVTFFTGVVMHYGLLKPIGITGSHGVVAEKAPGGLG